VEAITDTEKNIRMKEALEWKVKIASSPKIADSRNDKKAEDGKWEEKIDSLDKAAGM
jgi:hypothetical protein